MYWVKEKINHYDSITVGILLKCVKCIEQTLVGDGDKKKKKCNTASVSESNYHKETITKAIYFDEKEWEGNKKKQKTILTDEFVVVDTSFRLGTHVPWINYIVLAVVILRFQRKVL